MAMNHGTSAFRLMCDILVQRGVCDHPRAFELAQAFDRELGRYGWIDTLDGVAFSRDPNSAPPYAGRHLAFPAGLPRQGVCAKPNRTERR